MLLHVPGLELHLVGHEPVREWTGLERLADRDYLKAAVNPLHHRVDAGCTAEHQRLFPVFPREGVEKHYCRLARRLRNLSRRHGHLFDGHVPDHVRRQHEREQGRVERLVVADGGDLKHRGVALGGVEHDLHAGQPLGPGIEVVYPGVVGRAYVLVQQPVVGVVAGGFAAHAKHQPARAALDLFSKGGGGRPRARHAHFLFEHLVGVKQQPQPLDVARLRPSARGEVGGLDVEQRGLSVHHHHAAGLLHAPHRRIPGLLPDLERHPIALRVDVFEVFARPRAHARREVHRFEARHGLHGLGQQAHYRTGLGTPFSTERGQKGRRHHQRQHRRSRKGQPGEENAPAVRRRFRFRNFSHHSLLEIRRNLNAKGGLDTGQNALHLRVFAAAGLATGDVRAEIGRRVHIKEIHQAFLRFPTSHFEPPCRSKILRSFSMP